MYKCLKCNKKFKYESKLNEHNNRKTPCNESKKEYKCNFCKVNFNCQTEKNRHEKTKKHINNINIFNNVNQANINGDNIQNIINLTLSLNPFSETSYEMIRNNLINDITNNLYLDTINNTKLSDIDKTKELFKGIVELLEKVHFNLTYERNHNCKILLMFPGIKKSIYEYLILEIDSMTKNIFWKNLEYDTFIKEIINNFTRVNQYIKNDNFLEYLYFLETNILSNLDNKIILKPYIEEELGKLYMNFNNNQKKDNRDIKDNISDKIYEYKEYRNNECKLDNGYVPPIINGIIN